MNDHNIYDITDSRVFSEIAEELISGKHHLRFSATGDSMAPFIVEGDTVAVMPVSSPLKTGDVILLRRLNDMPLLHRIIRILPDGVVTRGDALIEDDGIIPLSNVLGKVSTVNGRALLLHLHFPLKYLICRKEMFTPALNKLPFIKRFIRKIVGLTDLSH